MMTGCRGKKELFTRKEVITLLKKQRDRSFNSFGLMPIENSHPELSTSEKVFKRLKKVSIIKF